jgi:hypothetical protein
MIERATSWIQTIPRKGKDEEDYGSTADLVNLLEPNFLQPMYSSRTAHMHFPPFSLFLVEVYRSSFNEYTVGHTWKILLGMQKLWSVEHTPTGVTICCWYETVLGELKYAARTNRMTINAGYQHQTLKVLSFSTLATCSKHFGLVAASVRHLIVSAKSAVRLPCFTIVTQIALSTFDF